MKKNQMSYTGKLAELVSKTKYEDFPEEVTHQTKRLILDILGCSLGAYSSEAGEIISRSAMAIGGEKGENTVIGSPHKTSCSAAAFANAELAKVLDADDAFLNFTHLGGSTVAASLAVSERVGASGKDLITAVALGFEVSARIGLSMPRGQRLVGERSALAIEGVKTSDFNWHCIGASAAASKLLNLNRDKIATAFGISGINVPIFSSILFKGYSSFIPMTKYGCLGTNAMNGIIAAFLSEQGYTASQTILDDPFGFWALMDIERMHPEYLSKGLGNKWWIRDVSYKIYPSCRVWHSALDAFYTILGKNNLTQDRIENVIVWLHPRFHGIFDLLSSDRANDGVSFQFCGPLNFSMAAFNIKPGPQWQAKERIENPKIKEFAKRVKLLPDPGFLMNVYDEIGNEPKPIKKLMGRVEVKTIDGMRFHDFREYAKGDPWHRSTRLSDAELIDKFRENATYALDSRQLDRVINQAYELDKVKNIRTFISLLVRR